MLRLFAFLVSLACSFSALAQGAACNKTVYLSFDTGNMSVAQLVSDVLNRQHVKATFFLANEKTSRGDFALDDSWKLSHSGKIVCEKGITLVVIPMTMCTF